MIEYIPYSFVDPTGKSGENIHELFSKEAFGLNSIANGFEAMKDSAVKTFDSFMGTAYKTIGEFTGVNSAVRVVGGVEPWSITASNPGQISHLTLSERVSEGVQTLAFAGLGHGLGALKESTLGIQMVDIVGFKAFTDTQIVKGLENLNTLGNTLSTVNSVFDGIKQESTLLK